MYQTERGSQLRLATEVSKWRITNSQYVKGAEFKQMKKLQVLVPKSFNSRLHKEMT